MTEAQLLAIEVQYFNFFAAKNKLDPEDILNSLRREQDIVSNYGEEYYGYTPENSFNSQQINTIEDYFGFRRKSFDYTKHDCIKTIIGFANRLPQFSSFKGIWTSSEDFKKSIEEIPFILLFEEVMGYAIAEEPNNNYVIRDYVAFDTFMTNFFVPIFYNSSFSIPLGKFEHKTRKDYSGIEITTLLNECIDILKSGSIMQRDQSEHILSHDLLSQNTDENMGLGRECFYGLQYFSFFHEYSHYILQHFDSSKDKNIIEYEADLLSLNLLIQNTIVSYKIGSRPLNNAFQTLVSSRLLGPATFFFVKVIENIDNEKARNNYILRYFYCKDIMEMTSIFMKMDYGSRVFPMLHNLFLILIEELGFDIAQLKSELQAMYNKHINGWEDFKFFIGPYKFDNLPMEPYLDNFDKLIR